MDCDFSDNGDWVAAVNIALKYIASRREEIKRKVISFEIIGVKANEYAPRRVKAIVSGEPFYWIDSETLVRRFRKII